MHGLIALFLGVIALAIILLVEGLGALWVLVAALRGIMALIVLMMIVGSAIIMIALVCFDGSRNFCGNSAAGSLIHGYARQEDEPFSFPSAASYP